MVPAGFENKSERYCSTFNLKVHKKNKDKADTNDEFLSGFYKEEKEFRNDWQSGIDQLKQSGTAGKIFASYSEGVVHNLDNTAAGTVQLVKDPLGTVSESVNYFLADPLRNNPIAAVGQYYKDIAKASYTGDWETVANKVGSGTATISVMGITGTLAEGGASKLLPKGINIDKTLRLPMLEMYEYAGVGGFELGVSTVSIPIKASISAGAVSTAVGVTASAAAGHGIYYSNKFYNQSSGGTSNNKIFTKTIDFNAGDKGTGITYKVYQRNDIDWDLIRTRGVKKARGLTNAEVAEKYGVAPILDDEGHVATLHHSQQNSNGPLYEVSARYHNVRNAQKAPLHPYKGQLNPYNPMDEVTRTAFQKVDSIEYWKERGSNAKNGVK